MEIAEKVSIKRLDCRLCKWIGQCGDYNPHTGVCPDNYINRNKFQSASYPEQIANSFHGRKWWN